LIQLDAIDPEAPQTQLDALLKIFGATDRRPHFRSLPGESAFCGDDQAIGIRVQGFSDEPLADLGSISIGRIDKVDTEFHGALQDAAGGGWVLGFTPNSRARDAHGTEPEAVNRTSLRKFEGSTLRCVAFRKIQ
jgi:hypothetical protein